VIDLGPQKAKLRKVLVGIAAVVSVEAACGMWAYCCARWWIIALGVIVIALGIACWAYYLTY
jgi:1,4-dihydroxy-2-naphthoate octaprenyltransferase